MQIFSDVLLGESTLVLVAPPSPWVPVSLRDLSKIHRRDVAYSILEKVQSLGVGSYNVRESFTSRCSTQRR